MRIITTVTMLLGLLHPYALLAQPIEITLWHHQANQAEMAAISASITRFNRSQQQWKVVGDTVPETSYTQSVTIAYQADLLPCVIDVDQPLVPYFAWRGVLTPLSGRIDEQLLTLNASGKGSYAGKVYSAGQFDAAVALFTRKSLLKRLNLRVPTLDQPWNKSEFMQVLEVIKMSGLYDYPFDMRASDRTEWIPYAFAPFMLSWGADLINRQDYQQVDGILNSPQAVEFAQWLHSLVKLGYMQASPADDQGLVSGRVAIQYNGLWALNVYQQNLQDDLAILPVPDFGHGSKIGGGSWNWAITHSCAHPEGAEALMRHFLSAAEIAEMSRTTSLIPTSQQAADLTSDYGPDGRFRIFYEFSNRFAILRPQTPAYSVISSSYKKAIGDILDGMDPYTSLDMAVENIEAAFERNKSYQSGQY